MDKLAFLEGTEEETIETEALQENPVETPEVTQEPVAEANTPAPVEAKPEPQAVPLPTFLDMRDKLKAAEARAKELEGKLQQPADPMPLPDMFEDPNAYTAQMQQWSAQQALNTKLDLSEDMARDKFGDDVVNQAQEWAKQQAESNPGFIQKVWGHANPYRFVVEQYQRDQIASQVNASDLEEFNAWRAQKAALQQQQAAPAVNHETPLPTPSIATAPSAGGVAHVPTGPGQAYDAMFRK